MNTNAVQHYIPKKILAECLHIASHTKYTQEGKKLKVTIQKNTFDTQKCDDFPQAVIISHCISQFVKNGPVLIKPPSHICKEMLDTKANFALSNYTQPYKIVGVVLPDEFRTQGNSRLMLVWKMDNEHIFVCLNTPDKNNISSVYFSNEGSLEEQLCFLELQGLPNTVRICLNMCMLASNRETVTTTPKKYRVRNNNNVNELAGREFREMVFRDLFIKARPHKPIEHVPVSTGIEQQPQHRREHGRWVAYGPKHSLRRWQRIGEYWTKKDSGKTNTVILE